METYNYLKVDEDDEYEVFLDGSTSTSTGTSTSRWWSNPSRIVDTTKETIIDLPQYTSGFSDRILLIVSFVGLFVLLVLIYKIVLLRAKTRSELEEEEEDLLLSTYTNQLMNANVLTLNRAQRRARAHAIMKQTRRRVDNTTTTSLTVKNNKSLNNSKRSLVSKDITLTTEDDSDDSCNDDCNDYNDYNDDDDCDDDNNYELDYYSNDNNDSNLQNLTRKERQQYAKHIEKKERLLYNTIREKQYLNDLERIKQEKLIRIQQKQTKIKQDRIQTREENKNKEQQDNFEFLTFLSTSLLVTTSNDSNTSITIIKDTDTNTDKQSYTISVVEWIEQLKINRYYNIQEISTLYNIPIIIIYNRIETLIKECRIAGIIDYTTQQFIYLSDNELYKISQTILNNNNNNQSVVSINDISKIVTSTIKSTVQ